MALKFDCVAQLRVPGAARRRVGSGLLIAERLVLTAGHVVDGSAAAAMIEILFPYAEARATGRVAWRGAAGLDAALVELRAPPSGPLRVGVPELRWGRLTGQRPAVPATGVGFPRVLKDGDERMPEQFAGTVNPGTGLGRRHDVTLSGTAPWAGAADPSPWSGLSGAALVCGDLLVGVVVIDTPGFRSGRFTAVPAWRLLADAGFRAVLERHRCAHAWESVELAGLFTHTRARLDSPASLLRADTAVVRFRGRGELLRELREWCEAPDELTGRLLIGPGGQGKTRFARRLCAELHEAGWVTGFASEHAPREAAAPLRDSRLPVLVVIDYAETRPYQVRELAEVAAEPAAPVRLLLLGRSAGEWWEQLLPRLRRSIRVSRAPLELAPVEGSVAGRRRAYDEAREDLAGALARLPDHRGRDWQRLAVACLPMDLEAPAYASILTIQLQALTDLLTAEAEAPVAAGPEQLEDVLLEHEQLYWSQTAARRGLVEPAFQPDTLRRAVAVATLCGAADEDEAIATLKRVPGLGDKTGDEHRGIARWLADLYPSGEDRFWGALQPDRVGEHLVGRVERDRPGLIAAALAGASSLQQSLGLTVLARAVTHQPQLGDTLRQILTAELPTLGPVAIPVALAAARPSPLLQALSAAVEAASHPDALNAVHDALPDQSLLLSELGLQVTQRLVTHHRARAETTPDAHLPALAASLNNLSNRLAGLGRRIDALAPIEEAVQIRRALAEAAPEVHLPNLTTSLNNLSNRLADLGRHGDALAPIEEAVRIRRRLAAAARDVYLPRLAGSLNNLANVLARLGRRADALVAIEDAVQTYRALAEAAPEAYLPNFAGSLNTLSIRLAELGRHAEALAAIEQGVRTYRALAEAQPDAYLPDLGRSLYNLSIRLAELGQDADALTAIQEAVQIRRELAEAAPNAYLPDLARSLNSLSNRLADLGRPADALAPIEEAVQIHRALAEALPQAHLAHLATSLYNLALLQADQARLEDARTSVREAISIYRVFAAAEPEAFLAHLRDTLALAVQIEEQLGASEERESLRRELEHVERRMGA